MSTDMPLPAGWSEPELTSEELAARLAAVKHQAGEDTPIYDGHDLEDALDAAADRIAQRIAHRSETTT
jgi:hypothetical protein